MGGKKTDTQTATPTGPATDTAGASAAGAANEQPGQDTGAGMTDATKEQGQPGQADKPDVTGTANYDTPDGLPPLPDGPDGEESWELELAATLSRLWPAVAGTLAEQGVMIRKDGKTETPTHEHLLTIVLRRDLMTVVTTDGQKIERALQ